MAAFAEVPDLEDRWRPLSPDEQTRAKVLLMDAAGMLAAEFVRCGRDIAAAPPELLAMVSCYMVRRVMAAGTDADVSQLGVTVGPFSQQVSFANPAAAMYVSAEERRLLGIPKRRQRVGSVPSWGGDR